MRWRIGKIGLLVFLASLLPLQGIRGQEESARRSEAHQKYATVVWEKIAGYDKWPQARQPLQFAFGPHSNRMRCYLAKTEDKPVEQMAHGALVVCEHLDADDAVRAVTVLFRADPGKGYEQYGDWYWAHFSPDGHVVKTVVDRAKYDKRGFLADVRDGRLWVFHVNSPEVAEYVATGEPPEKHTTKVGAGPARMTVRGPDAATINHYLAVRDGFEVQMDEEGRVWVFQAGSEEARQALSGELPEKHVTRPGAGPGGATLKAVDAQTLDQYIVARPGFETVVDAEGRLWVFRAGSPEWQAFQQDGEPEKVVIRPGAGPGGKTIKAPDAETIDAYLGGE